MFDALKKLDLDALPADVREVVLGLGQRNAELEERTAALATQMLSWKR